MIETATTRGAEGFDRRAFTVEDVERMLEAGILDWDEKFELIRGEIVPMNAQLSPHALIKSRLGSWFGRHLDPAAFDVAVDVTVKLGSIGLFDPDVFICQRVPVLKREYLPIGAALLVIEVADTSLRRDRDMKAPDYGKSGLAELWIVDLNSRSTLVLQQSGAGAFGPGVSVPFESPLSPLFAPTLSLKIAEIE